MKRYFGFRVVDDLSRRFKRLQPNHERIFVSRIRQKNCESDGDLYLRMFRHQNFLKKHLACHNEQKTSTLRVQKHLQNHVSAIYFLTK